jgi:ERCC4-type nuclease
MPKNPPDQIHIRIDTLEQRSGIPDMLAAMTQVHIEVIPLRAGDYDVGGDPCRVLERVSVLVDPERGCMTHPGRMLLW